MKRALVVLLLVAIVGRCVHCHENADCRTGTAYVKRKDGQKMLGRGGAFQSLAECNHELDRQERKDKEWNDGLKVKAAAASTIDVAKSYTELIRHDSWTCEREGS